MPRCGCFTLFTGEYRVTVSTAACHTVLSHPSEPVGPALHSPCCPVVAPGSAVAGVPETQGPHYMGVKCVSSVMMEVNNVLYLEG